MNEIKHLLIETNHKYKEEHSKMEINLFFSLYPQVYIITSNRKTLSLIQMKKGLICSSTKTIKPLALITNPTQILTECNIIINKLNSINN